MLISVDNFQGMAPSIHPAVLPDQAAQWALNCRLGLGSIEPLKGVTAVGLPTKAGEIKAIFPFANKWLNWISDVDVCRSAIADDAWDRVYFTGGSVFAPQYTVPDVATAGSDFPTASYTLGIPAPLLAPTVSAAGEITDTDPTLVESRSYVYTYVSAYGEEGPPSAVSAMVDVAPGQHVDVSGLLTAPAGAYNIAIKRIYRTNTGSSGTEFQLVASLDIAAATYADSIAAAALGSVLASATWDAPPTDLHSLISLPCGAMAGLSGNQLCFSEPYLPHAWPVEYRLAFDSEAVALGAFGSSVLIVTEGAPYVVTGSHPASMSQERLEEGYASVSKRGMVDTGYAVIWPSVNGLMAAGMGQVKLLTQGIISPQDWAAMVPASIHAYLWDQKYVAFWNNSSGAAGFVFDPVTGNFTVHDVAATAGYHDPLTGILYLVVDGEIVTWNSGAAKTAVWESKRFVLPYPASMSCAQVRADAYPVTLNVYADGVLVASPAVASAKPFRLPGGFLPDSYAMSVASAAKVTLMAMASSMEELAQV